MYRKDIPWQALEKHHKDTQKIMKDLGFVDDKARLWRFNGKTFWPLFEEAGHDQSDVNVCKCGFRLYE